METCQKRACALVRVSSEEQAKGGYGLEYQEQDIRTFCKRAGLNLIKVFRDEGYSGATPNRPGFKEMMEWARQKRFDVLVAWKLDRLFRDTKLTLQTVDELAILNIEFRSVQEAFTHDSNGRFLLTIFAAGAEKERKDIAMRMHAGRTMAARNGILVSGGSIPPYGYRYNRATKRLEIDQEEASVVKKIFRWLVEEKQSLYKIQLQLNDLGIPTKYDRLGRKKLTGSKNWWRKRTIGRMLTNEVYTGRFTFRKYRLGSRAHNEANFRPREEWITIDTPRIVSRELFERAQEQLKRNAENSPRRTQKLYLLAKLLICGHDGRRMQAATRLRNETTQECKYYFCSAIRKTHSPVRCPSRTVSESRIVEPAWAKLRELLSQPAAVLQGLATFQQEQGMVLRAKKRKEELERKRQHTEQQMRRVVEVYVGGAIEKVQYDSEYRKLRGRIEELEREIRKIEGLSSSAERIVASKDTIQRFYEQYKGKLEGASDQQKREIFQTFIKAIVVRDDELEIEINLPRETSFEGQPIQRLSRKELPPLFLKTKLLPVSEVFSGLEMHRNLGKYAVRKRAA